MPLTPAQLQTIRTNVASIPAMAAALANGSFSDIAGYYNTLATPAFHVWRRDTPVDEIFDKIIWANMTPTFTPATDTTTAWSNRSLACQGKQFNLQTILIGKSVIDGARKTVRDGLQDALTDLPSGNNGNPRQAGWTQVQIAMTRRATRLEQLFANTTDGSGTANTTPALAVLEGTYASDDFVALRDLQG